MGTDLLAAAGRFERFAADVLAPAVYTDSCPLAASVLQCPEPIPYADAARAEYSPVDIGWQWGPVWSTAWFRVAGEVPRRLDARRVALRFSTATEALLYRDAHPVHGLDLNRDAVLLFDRAEAGDKFNLLVEAACTHHLGQLGTHWDPAEFRARWKSPTPGRLERCELAAIDDTAWRLHRAYLFALQLMRELPSDSARGQSLFAALRRATNAIDDARFVHTATHALEVILAALAQPAGGTAPICHAVGHAHIDTAWLWPIRETKRKCVRTFATALANLERFPDFRFLCSQAQQYAWIEESHPALFERIRAQVNAGRWEPGGAMWIEPDCNLVSGESLVRQIIHGVRYWRSRFGDHAPQTYLYLPDTFGFTPALPQIMRLAGLHTFITHKLSWNQTNRWPHTHFIWRGLDGSEVLAHQMPGHDYNLQMSPRELRRGEKNHDNLDLGVHTPARYLQPFGFGDGGGGPTDWQVLHAQLAADCEGLPRVRMSRADEFCAAFARDRDEIRAAGEDFPAWHGELYLEAHRGTYTTQAWIKLANRRAEDGLRAAEILTWGAPHVPADAAARRAEQDAAWKRTLLNQFHDIIPGSSIAWVYEDAARDLALVRQTVDAHTGAGLAAWAAAMNTEGLTRPVMIYNPTSATGSGVVEAGGELLYVDAVPAIGVRVVDAARAGAALPPTGPARFEGTLRLCNGLLEASFNDRGQLTSLRRVGGRELVAGTAPAMAELILYEDRPRNWDAWDIDPEYDQKGAPVTFDASGVEIGAMCPLRASLIVKGKFGRRSSITLEYILDAGSPRLDVRATVNWHESHRLLRVRFPTALRASHATYECAFGHLRRPTTRNTSHERAAFEVPAHRWVDLTDDAGDAGLAILNDCKYGHSCYLDTGGAVIGLSLLRAPSFPDETADIGLHRFTFAMLPHDGDWRTAAGAGVDAEAECLNTPLMAWSLAHSQAGALGASWAPVEITTAGTARATIAALKAAEDDDRFILRLVETRGGRGVAHVHWNIPVGTPETVDLLEQPIAGRAPAHDAAARRTSVSLGPFEIVTIAVRRTPFSPVSPLPGPA